MNSTEALTLILVLITGFYAWQTRKTVNAMEEANEANNRPVVSISLHDRIESVSFLDLRITNAGRGLARDIQFEVNGDDIEVNAYNAERKQPLSHRRFIKDGIEALAPNETRSYWLLSAIGRVDELQNSSTTLKIIYFNNNGKKYTDEFSLDFSSLPEGRLGSDPAHKISKEIEKIRKEVEKMRKRLDK